MKKIDRIITATDEDPTYFDFLPSIGTMWKNYGYRLTCGLVTSRTADDPMVMKARKYADIVLLKPIPGINPGNQAKVSRLYLTTLCADETVMIADIDYYVFQPQFFEKSAQEVTENQLVITGRNGYDDTPDEGKFPMCGVMGKGNVFSQIVNPKKLDYQSLLKSWIGLDGIDGKEDLSKRLYTFSDESLLRFLLQSQPQRAIYLDREDMKNQQASKRVDMRAGMWAPGLLFEGYYIDCQPFRPIKDMDLIFEYLKLKDF